MKRITSGPPKVSVVAKVRRTKEQAYTANWNEISAAVKRRAGHKCQRCGNSQGPFETDHIIPVARGGLTVMYNLWCLCLLCHSKRPGHKHLFRQRVLRKSGR